MLPPFSVDQALTAWRFDPWVGALVAVIAAGYGWRLFQAHRLGIAWPWWRVAVFALLGLGGMVVTTMSSLAVYQHTVLWALVVQVTVLLTLVPVAFAASDPVGLLRAGMRPEQQSRLDRLLLGRIARIVTFPLVAAVIGVVVQMFLFFGPVLRPALENRGIMAVVYVIILGSGCLLAWPLVGEGLLPSWCTPPLRLLFAAMDGLVDAIPGIALAASSGLIAGGYYEDVRPRWVSDVLRDQHLAGALAVAVAEVVTIPLLVVLFFQWASRELAAPQEPREPSEDSGPSTDGPWWHDNRHFGGRTDEYLGRKRSHR